MVSAMNFFTFIVLINGIIGITNGRSALQSKTQALRFEQCRDGCLQKVHNNFFHKNKNKE